MRQWPYNPYRHIPRQIYETHYRRYDIHPLQRHFNKNKHHYHFTILCIILGALAAIALTLAQH
jgi:hypothetical protein